MRLVGSNGSAGSARQGREFKRIFANLIDREFASGIAPAFLNSAK